MNTSFASQRTDAQSGNTQEYRTLITYTIAALLVALIVRFFIAAPYVVSGASMDPAFETWDYLVIDKFSYHFEEPQRGDVVVFRYPYDPQRSFIKRVIGLPGETIVLQANTVIIKNAEHPDGMIIDEPYIAKTNERPSDMSITLGSDQYFVMGDNRRASADSRSWGALPRENIVGRAFVRLFPFSTIDLLPAQATYQ